VRPIKTVVSFNLLFCVGLVLLLFDHVLLLILYVGFIGSGSCIIFWFLHNYSCDGLGPWCLFVSSDSCIILQCCLLWPVGYIL